MFVVGCGSRVCCGETRTLRPRRQWELVMAVFRNYYIVSNGGGLGSIPTKVGNGRSGSISGSELGLFGLVARSIELVLQRGKLPAWLGGSWAQTELRPPREWERRVLPAISGRLSSSGRLTASVGEGPRAAEATARQWLTTYLLP